ncbi:ABC transporter [Podospora aff. communis PSN243]|uniref:ABC transporter n=1 Tax=Podospora aff. communis PSN243 TaxID=3040156 RepID=A0AAV9G887_9PEZI|nr:ABC transporter [Podospora aff. communis PSN243]
MATHNGSEAACLNDDSFGLTVVGCRDNFDFTRTFEQSILSIAPSALMISFACARLSYLFYRPIVVHGGQRFLLLKATAISIFIGLQIALLAVTCNDPAPKNRMSIPATTLTLCASISLLPLSFLEHSRSPKPSTLLSTYLLLTLVFDIAQTRTQWLSFSQALFTKMFTASLATKMALLLLESQHKSAWMGTKNDASWNPELTSGIFSQSFYVWMNRLISRGYTSTLSPDRLYGLDEAIGAASQMSSHHSAEKDWLRWRSKPSLLLTVFWTLRGPFLAPVIPRLALGGFVFCQPFLINALLSYLQQSPALSNRNVGYGLIGAAAVIYTGIAVSTGLYWRAHQRALCKLRAYLIVAVYGKLVSKSAHDERNASAITLMNSDIMGIQGGFQSLHELWASFIETAIASWLLYLQLGPAFVVPIIIVLICTGLTLVVGKYTGERFRASMQILQQRIGISSAAIPNLVSIKASAMTNTVGKLIQTYRIRQIDAMKRFRILTTISTVLAFAPILLSPVVTFSISMGDMTIARVFTSLAWIHLLCQPMIQLLQSVPQILAAAASIGRVQEFLESESRVDLRSKIEEQKQDANSKGPATITDEEADSSKPKHEVLVRASDCKMGWKADNWVLEGVSLSLSRSTFTLLLGPVASGKSTLCKALVGEIPFLNGTLEVAQPRQRTAYCDQDSFLFNTTIRENIIGFNAFHGPWYEEVVHACQLAEDFAALPEADHTQVGSKGGALSGGQKRRVALARAIYARPGLAILDDPLGGLDSKTGSQLAHNVFGPNGIFRRQKTTVFIVGRVAQHAQYMDQILVLRDKGIIFQGSVDQLRSSNDEALSELCRIPETPSREPDSTTAPQFTAQPAEKTEGTKAAFPEGGLANYRYYFSAFGIPLLVLYLMFNSCFSFLYSFSAVWLNFWSESNQKGEQRIPFYLGVYFMLQIVCLGVLALDVWWLGNVVGPKAGIEVHLRTLRTLLGASLRYYTTVDNSVTTGYFSQDMRILDGELNNGVGNTMRTALVVIGQAALIAAASPYLLIGYPILLAVFYCVQKVYLRTSTQLRHLVLESKNPLYKHFIETVDGLLTIRAFGWVESHIQLNGKLIDESQRPSYLIEMLQQWLSLVLNMCAACIAVLVTALATQLRTSAGFTGVALVSLMSFGDMAGHGIRLYTQLQTSTAALSRLRGFETGVCGEDEQDVLAVGTSDVPAEWLGCGKVELKRVTASYAAPEGPSEEEGKRSAVRALRELTLSVLPGERVLVCGRTGSGKSSLLLLLQGFLLPSSGEVRIDNVSLHTIPRNLIRNRIISLPQTPFFIPNNHTFRENLEFHDDDSFLTSKKVDTESPKQQTQDTECEYALRAVGLWDLVISQGGLDAELRDETLSRGQKQLFSLARAIVRRKLRSQGNSEEEGGQKGGMLLLDEYNAGLDDETDKIMWETILREFQGYTVICVAHRVQFVKGFDKVVVMGGGEILETGSPDELLRREGGQFRGLFGDGSRGEGESRLPEGGVST